MRGETEWGRWLPEGGGVFPSASPGQGPLKMTDSEIRRCLLDLDDTLAISEGEQIELSLILRTWRRDRLSPAMRRNAVRICKKHPDYEARYFRWESQMPRRRRYACVTHRAREPRTPRWVPAERA